jgi:hypothetical protein
MASRSKERKRKKEEMSSNTKENNKNTNNTTGTQKGDRKFLAGNISLQGKTFELNINIQRQSRQQQITLARNTHMTKISDL